MRTLLAEDSVFIRGQFNEMLRVFRQGEKDRIYTNGTNAPESIRALKSGIAIENINMSGFNGFEVVPSKRKANRNVIFFHLGFFTIRVLPRKGHARLLRLFF